MSEPAEDMERRDDGFCAPDNVALRASILSSLVLCCGGTFFVGLFTFLFYIWTVTWVKVLEMEDNTDELIKLIVKMNQV